MGEVQRFARVLLQTFQSEPQNIAVGSALPVLNDALLAAPVLVQGYYETAHAQLRRPVRTAVVVEEMMAVRESKADAREPVVVVVVMNAMTKVRRRETERGSAVGLCWLSVTDRIRRRSGAEQVDTRDAASPSDRSAASESTAARSFHWLHQTVADCSR